MESQPLGKFAICSSGQSSTSFIRGSVIEINQLRKVLNWPSLKVSGHEVIWLASGQLLSCAIARVWREIGETWTCRKATTLLDFPRFIYDLFVPARSWCTLKGSLLALISLWPSGNPFKRNHHHFAWHSATDMTILSATTRSAICFSATYQEGQRAQRAWAEVDI